MKAVLISPVANVTAPSLRVLAAVLARAGHDVVQVFCPDQAVDARRRAIGEEFRNEVPFPETLVEDIADVCADARFVGLTVMTNHFERAADLTARLRRRVRAPLVWGGIHPTVRPEECLRFADAVARGEAEETLPAFVRRLEAGEEWWRTPGFSVRRDGDVVANDVPAPPAELGALPHPLYQPGKDFIQIRETGRLAPFTDDLFAVYTDLMSPYANAGVEGPLYMVAASRGCPHACSFCCSAYLKRLHAGYRRARCRPIGDIIDELAAARRRWPFLKFVWFSDDEFFSMPEESLAEFARRYPAEVGLPFRGLISAEAVTRERLEKLVPLGFFMAQMGVQSVAPALTRYYRRDWADRERIREAVAVMHDFAPAFTPAYDIIIDNPRETTRERLETCRFISTLPRPFFLQTFSLTYYPGTEIYERARADGLIRDEVAQVYRKNYLKAETRDYVYYLTTLNNTAFPPALLRVLAWAPFVWLGQYPPGSWAFRFAAAAARRVWRALKGRGR